MTTMTSGAIRNASNQTTAGSNNQPPREYDTGTKQFTYDGKGGVPIGNWFNRLAFAAKYAPVHG